MKKNRRLIFLILFFVILILGAELLGLRSQFSLEYIRSVFNNHFIISSLIYISLFIIGNLLSIPGTVFLFGSIFALGNLNGGLLTYVAALISCGASYLFVSYLGKDSLRNFEDKKIAKKFFKTLDTYPVRSMIILRVMFQTFPSLNYTLALSRVRFKDYMIACFIGLPVPISLYCIFFDLIIEIYQKSSFAL